MAGEESVKLPDSAYKRLERIARRRHSRVEEELVEAVESHIQEREAYLNDPFFTTDSLGASGLGDLAEKHDAYLYETNE